MTIPMYDYKQRSEEIANAYWRARWKPGGTIEKPRYEFTVDRHGETTARKVGTDVDHSRECAALWVLMGALTEEATQRSRARFIELGAPATIAEYVGPDAPVPCASGGGVRARTFMEEDDFHRIAHDLELSYLQEASNGFRACCHDGERLIFSYCEGDVDIEWFFSTEHFGVGLRRAQDFYRTAA